MSVAIKEKMPPNGIAEPPRKKLKTSDLPLASATRASIEGLAHTFKKKGGYDSLRKQIWEDLEKSDFEAEFSKRLLDVAEQELDKNANQLLKLERGKATLLLDGMVDRAGGYQSAEAAIDALIDKHVEEIEQGIRKVRREDIGDEAAAAEEARGSKTDEEYAREAEERREARELVRTAAREKEKAALDEKRREEKARKKEEERKIDAETERRRAEREARRKAEREREEEKERERERDRERDREKDRERDRARDRERDRGSRDYRSSRFDVTSGRRDSRDVKESKDDKDSKDEKDPIIKAELSQEEIDRLEQEALNDLLKEGKRISQRSTRHQMEHEIDEALAPPPRKTMPASAIKPKDSPIVKPDIKTELKIPTGPKALLEAAKFRPPFHPRDDRSDRRRSRSRDRESIRRSSRSRSRRRSRDRGSVRSSRRDSRDRDDRRRRDSRDRDNKPRDRSQSKDRRRSRRDRSHSNDREKREREAARSRERVGAPPISLITSQPPLPRTGKLEDWKRAEAKKREQEARAYLAEQQDARAKGLPIPGLWSERKADDASKSLSPTSVRKRDGEKEKDGDGHRDRDRERSSRARSRSPAIRRTSRIERSTSPINIDRYVPSTSSRRRDSTVVKRERSRSRDRDRDRERDRERDKRSSRDEEKPRRRSRSRSRSRRRDRDRSRDRERRKRSRSRSRSPYTKRERDSRRERSRSRNKDRERRRERSRSRDKDREHRKDRDSSRTRDAKKESRESRRE